MTQAQRFMKTEDMSVAVTQGHETSEPEECHSYELLHASEYRNSMRETFKWSLLNIFFKFLGFHFHFCITLNELLTLKSSVW